MNVRYFSLSAPGAVLGLLLLVAVSGCASNGSDISYSGLGHANDEFQRAANREPIPETLLAVARILVAQGRDAEAKPILERLVTDHRRFVAGYCDLAELQMRSRRLGDAMTTLQAGLEVAPEEPTLLNNLGMCWMLRDQHERALEYFTRAAALAPDDARYRANMATALGLQGRYDESLAVYKQIVSDARAHHNVGVLSEARLDHERAAEQFAVSRSLDPQLK